jgi:hypothetical protein
MVSSHGLSGWLVEWLFRLGPFFQCTAHIQQRATLNVTNRVFENPWSGGCFTTHRQETCVTFQLLRGAVFAARAAAAAAIAIVTNAPSIIAAASPRASTCSWVPIVTAATGTPIWVAASAP